MKYDIEALTDAQIDEIWDRFEDAPTLSYRYLVTEAILAAVREGLRAAMAEEGKSHD